MIFQDSLGIEIQDNQVCLAYLQKSFKGINLGAYSIYSLDNKQDLKEKLDAVKIFLTEFKNENKIKNTDIFLGISHDSAILKELEFPLAVKENLRATLRYEMEKYIPISVDNIYFDYQILEENKVSNKLKVILIVAKKSIIEPYAKFCKSISGGVSGIEISSVSFVNFLSYIQNRKLSKPSDLHPKFFLTKPYDKLQQEIAKISSDITSKLNIPSLNLISCFGLGLKGLWPAPVEINLLPLEYRQRPGRAGYYFMISLIFLVILSAIVWTGSHVFHQQLKIKELNTEMQRLTSEIKEIDNIQTHITEIEANIEQLNTLSKGYISISDILRELTQIIPETAWVRDFSLTKKGIQLNGYAESASELIGLLEASPLFKNVVFSSTIVKDQDGKERFSIGLVSEQLSVTSKQ